MLVACYYTLLLLHSIHIVVRSTVTEQQIYTTTKAKNMSDIRRAEEKKKCEAHIHGETDVKVELVV